jgi:hypothetical protein
MNPRRKVLSCVAGALVVSSAVVAGLALAATSSPSTPGYMKSPFYNTNQIGAAPGSPNSQDFRPGDPLFYSSIILWNRSDSLVTTLSAKLDAGSCAPTGTTAHMVTVVPTDPSASYFPFGYGPPRQSGWILHRVRGFKFGPHARQFEWLVFGFRDSRNCVIKISAIDVSFRANGKNGVERLMPGGMLFIPTGRV